MAFQGVERMKGSLAAQHKELMHSRAAEGGKKKKNFYLRLGGESGFVKGIVDCGVRLARRELRDK